MTNGTTRNGWPGRSSWPNPEPPPPSVAGGAPSARGAAAEQWAEREAVIRRGGERHAVAGFDLTFSPPKSVSVLWAAATAGGPGDDLAGPS